MKKLLLITFVVFLYQGIYAQQTVNIIPKPVSLKLTAGSFTLNPQTVISLNGKRKTLKPVATFLAAAIQQISGYNVSVKHKSTNVIELSLTNNQEIGEEGYKMQVSSNRIKIEANTPAGIIYGIQSLLQTLPQIRTNAVLKVPAMEIVDFPRFKWRGMHLDVSRHFFGPEVVKEYINLMATYKLNTFHWHLVDDQGWRIEIKKYPKLTEIGAWRVDETDKVWSSRPQAKPGEPATYGGFYTQEQIKEIIKYAAQRNITIVPEIEMPGHVASAIASYTYLSCTQKPQLPLTGGDYTGMSSNYCAGNDSVFTFLEDVLDEVTALFPSKYIHIGGDEVDKTSWKHCPKCQARIKHEGLKNENELQSYFITRIEKYLISKNKKMIGWDEILEGGLAPEATVMSWRGEGGGIQAAKMKHDVVMTPGNPVYFDHYQAGPEGEPLAIGGFNTLKRVYDYEPIPHELNAEEQKFVLGAQANLWTEYITTKENVEYMVLPRMLALAEVVWTPKENKDWLDFNQRLKYHFRGFEQKGYHYSPGNFTVHITPISKEGKLLISLSTEIVNGEIYYTLDGTDPDTQSTRYTEPILINSSAVLKAVTVINGKAMGTKPVEQTFVIHKAIGKNVNYTYPVSRYYQADGPNSLTDGVKGTYAVGKYWHGFSGKDLIATIDLDTQTAVSTISLGCLQNYSDWIFMPQWVKFEVSENGKDFTEVQLIKNPVSLSEKSKIYNFTAQFKAIQARFIRVSAKVLDALPKGHSGEGKPAWLFADEITVN
ncbi:glycoside hydrolase family 20 protein [Pedobacter arcticus]|uniref:glycoside hydrolase family 20 protein n=1 Tax=Pedobacter arcticus TaxID=752140 RepID=UPI0002F8975A|nr:family 20 glycosylhydrolase [Pedobacter arcticus]